MPEWFPGQIPEEEDTPEIKVDEGDEKDEKKKRKSWYELLAENKDEKEDKLDEKEPTEKVSEEEKPVVYEAYVEGREDQIVEQIEATEAGSTEEAELIVDAAFIQNIHEQISESETGGIDLDAAMHEALVKFELPEPIDEMNDESWDEDTEIALGSPVEADEETPPSPPAASTPTRPPIPPTPPPAGPTMSSGGFSPPGPAGPPIIMPGTRAPMPNPAETPSTIERRPNAAGYFFLGGIVGYLIGRRRGRIRTENELLPVQEKLEKEVTDLQDEIIRREAKIRDIVRNQVEHQPDKRTEITARQEQDKASATEKHADAFHKQEMKPGRLGRLVLERSSKAETQPENANAAMQFHELLAVAERIEIEHVSVRKLYEEGRIDYQTLREVINEYLQGGDFERILKHQLRPERMTDKVQLAGRSINALQNSGSPGQSIPMADPSKAQNPFSAERYFNQRPDKKPASYIAKASMASAGILLAFLLVIAGALFLLGIL